MTTTGIERGPQVLNFTPDYVAEKLRALNGLGLPAVKIANTHPATLNLRSEYVSEKLAFLTGLGFNAVHLIEKKPGILALTAETVKAKVRIFNAAARAWGWEEPEQQAIRLVQEWPVILTYSPTKLRTLARMASSAFEARDGATVRGTEVSALVSTNLEQAVVAYLENEGEIIRPKDVVRLAKRYKAIGKQALRERIISERRNPVVVTYLRS
ncbi:MAG TPA: hypothetical protein VJ836_06755 [Candidatus Saccharimonadales bacterium]|nr:hypothetical protein [Candidatus Saccharimonadales bacterium]